jgi:hypothetical protein
LFLQITLGCIDFGLLSVAGSFALMPMRRGALRLAAKREYSLNMTFERIGKRRTRRKENNMLSPEDKLAIRRTSEVLTRWHPGAAVAIESAMLETASHDLGSGNVSHTLWWRSFRALGKMILVLAEGYDNPQVRKMHEG